MKCVMWTRALGAMALFGSSLAGCEESGRDPVPGGAPTPQAIAQAVAAACPVADASDEAARRGCAERLRDDATLAKIMGADVLWGGHSDQVSWNPAVHNTTRFNPRVWRMMYLSQFMFSGAHTIQTEGSYTAIRMAATFRRDMDIGQYPYPLWHSAAKWDAHLYATEIILVLRNDTLVAGYRFGNDTSQPRVERAWDGRWTWDDSGELEPRVALFTYILTPTNPHLEELNDSYRALETKFREDTCNDCHSPDNPEKMTPLALLALPNQALGELHRLIDVLEVNEMPPDEGLSEAHRTELLTLVREFARIGDEALAFEGEAID